MSAAEFAFWREYHKVRGFTADRLEGATALAGEYVGSVWGGKREAQELVPKFGARKSDMRVLAAQLAALPGAKVRRVPRTKPPEVNTHGQK